MSQPTSTVGLGVPLSSNNKANPYTSLGGSGGVLTGVESLNGLIGNLAVVGDASVGVTSIGSGQLQFSTAGRPQNVGAVSAASVASAGAVSGASVTSSGAVAGATVAASGAITGATVATTGTDTASQFIQSSQLVPSLFPRGLTSLSGTITFTSPTNVVPVASFGINASGLPTINISGAPVLLMMTMSPANRANFGAGTVPMSLVTQWVYPQNDGTYNPVTIAGMTAAGTPSTGASLAVTAAGAADGTMKNMNVSAFLANPSLYNNAFNWNITVLTTLPNVAY